MITKYLQTGLLLAFLTLPSRADVCDDIHRLANRWHDLANYIHDHSDNGKLRPKEIAKVGGEARQLLGPTKTLGDFLVKEYDGSDAQRVRAQGKQILAALEELGALKEDDDWDEDVKIIDRLVDVTDNVVNVCDSK
jgi:hypothetical protein